MVISFWIMLSEWLMEVDVEKLSEVCEGWTCRL